MLFKGVLVFHRAHNSQRVFLAALATLNTSSPMHIPKGTATSPSKTQGATPDLAQEHSPGCPCIPQGAASRSVGGKEDISPCPVEKHSWQFKTNSN